MQERVRGSSSFEEALWNVEAHDLSVERCLVYEGCNSPSGWNPGLPRHLQWEKNRATTQTSLDQVFQRVDRTESSKEARPSCQEWVRSQLALRLLSPRTLQLYRFHMPSPLLSVTLLACSLDASPCMPAVHCTTVRFKALHCKIKIVSFFVFVFLCPICVKSSINRQPVVLAGYLGSVCWTQAQTGLQNILLECSSFVGRGLPSPPILYLILPSIPCLAYRRYSANIRRVDKRSPLFAGKQENF